MFSGFVDFMIEFYQTDTNIPRDKVKKKKDTLIPDNAGNLGQVVTLDNNNFSTDLNRPGFLFVVRFIYIWNSIYLIVFMILMIRNFMLHGSLNYSF